MTRLAFVIVASLAASSTAFAPSHTNSRSLTSIAAKDIKKEIGVLEPVGFFNPLNLIKNGPYGDEAANFYHYQSVEVKHGRIAMAATVGTLVQQNNHFEGYISPSNNLKFSDVPNGLGALDVIPLAGCVQLVVLIGIHEVLVKSREGKKPGDFGTGYLGVKVDDESDFQLTSLNKEIQNGRLAMLGILGMWASEIVHNGEPLAEVSWIG